MGTVIAFANQKGGVGKTTGVANVGAALAMMGERRLMIDADPQGNLGEAFGVDGPHQLGLRLEDALEAEGWGEPPPIWQSRTDGDSGERVALAGDVHLLPCTAGLADTAAELAGLLGAEYRLRDLVGLYRDAYDYVLVDTPPGLGPLSSMAMLAPTG